MAYGAVDRVIFFAPAHLRQKLGDHKSVGRLFDMLSITPPAEVVYLLKILVGAFKQRHIAGHPAPSHGVGDVIGSRFAVELVERSDVMLERPERQQRKFDNGLRLRGDGNDQ